MPGWREPLMTAVARPAWGRGAAKLYARCQDDDELHGRSERVQSVEATRDLVPTGER
jgi:hypothetical protein